MAVQGGRVGHPGRIHQDGPLPLPAQAGQDREQQVELAEAGVPGDQFGHRAERPAPAGQAGVQAGVAGGQGRLAVADLAAFPQVGGGVQ